MPPPPDPDAVFLNIPYDKEFQDLSIAYIVGLYQLGLVPHIASEIPGGVRRLDRILRFIQNCRYSIHDLSRVEVSVGPSATPRFNMPLELGMTIIWESLDPQNHTWFVWEPEPFRLQKSTSDLKGSDPYIHNGEPDGVLRELRNAFIRDRAPSVDRMAEIYYFVRGNFGMFLRKNKTTNPYDRSVFMELCWLSANLASLFRHSGK